MRQNSTALVRAVADHVVTPENRHHRPMRECGPRGQMGEPGPQPSEIPDREGLRRVDPYAGRQDQFGAAARRIDPQQHPARPRATPDRNRDLGPVGIGQHQDVLVERGGARHDGRECT
ncbi:MAG: hypothetical protein ACMVO3_02305 [Thalassobaculum sp.]